MPESPRENFNSRQVVLAYDEATPEQKTRFDAAVARIEKDPADLTTVYSFGNDALAAVGVAANRLIDLSPTLQMGSLKIGEAVDASNDAAKALRSLLVYRAAGGEVLNRYDRDYIPQAVPEKREETEYARDLFKDKIAVLDDTIRSARNMIRAFNDVVATAQLRAAASVQSPSGIFTP